MPGGWPLQPRAAEAATLHQADERLAAQSRRGPFVICHFNKKHYKLTSPQLQSLWLVWEVRARKPSRLSHLFIYLFFCEDTITGAPWCCVSAICRSSKDKIRVCENPPNLWCPIFLSCHSVLQAVIGFAYS